MKLFTSLIIATLIALVIAIAPATASTSRDVTILSDMYAMPDGTFGGTFEASGPAVEDGLICPDGTVTDVSVSAAGGQSPTLILFVHKHFMCYDGSGSFEMDLNVRIASSGTTARWLIVSGSGNYVNLFGEGDLYATSTGAVIHDTYSGQLHVEAAVSTPKDVTILSDMSASQNGTFEGTFEASGPAVEAGLICPVGIVLDEDVKVAGGKSPVLILFVHKHFECSDDSGSFEMDLNVRIAPSGTTARWLIVSGSGNYVNLFGEGDLYATSTDTGLTDTYTGKLNIH